MSNNECDRGERGGVPNLQMQAMMQKMRKMMQEGFDQVMEHVDHIEERSCREQSRRGRSLRIASLGKGEAVKKLDNDGQYGNDDERVSNRSYSEMNEDLERDEIKIGLMTTLEISN